MPNVKIYSWNVNGIRAVMKKGAMASFLAEHDPDILCLQETKAHAEQVNLSEIPTGYELFFNAAEKRGYSGTAIFTKLKPIKVTYGIGVKKHDKEGRVTTAEFKDWFLVCVYTPNSQNELRRLDYRTQEWDVDFLDYVRNLPKPVIFCGDLNVAHKEIDIARPKPNRKNAGFTFEECARLDAVMAAGYLDSFRVFHPDNAEEYSWWSFRAGARKRNVGWRIDYVIVDKKLKRRLKDAKIHQDVEGSDHCPVSIELALPKNQLPKASFARK